MPKDAASYRKLMLEAYELAPESFTSSVAEGRSRPDSWWSARVADVPSATEIVVGTFVDGSLIGVAGLSFEQRERTRHKAKLFGMYVQEHGRGRGLGSLLVREVLRQAKLRPNITVVQLTVSEGNVLAIRLYRSCGFMDFGMEPFAVRFGSRFISKIHMWQEIVHVS